MHRRQRPQVDDDGNVSGAFAEIRRGLRTQYAIANKPSNIADAAFHRMEIVARQRLHVRCRSGYYVR